MTDTSSPKRLALRIRAFVMRVYKRSLSLMVLAAIWQLALAFILLFGIVIWDVEMVDKVKTTQSAGPAQAAGMQPEGHHAWLQTSTGLYFLRTPMSIVFGEEITLQTRGEGSRYLCSRSNGCTRILSD